MDLTNWRGADVVVDAAGHPNALRATAGYVRMGGQISIPAVYLDESLDLPWGDFFLRGVTFTMGASHFHNYIDEVIALILAGKLAPPRSSRTGWVCRRPTRPTGCSPPVRPQRSSSTPPGDRIPRSRQDMSMTIDHSSENGTTPDLDISARSFWAKPFEEREKTFAWLRENEPVKYHRPYESTLQPPDEDTPGFWSLAKYEDCRMVSRTPELFCSAQGILMESFPEVVQVASTSFLAMDGDDHFRLRSIVSQAFTPRAGQADGGLDPQRRPRDRRRDDRQGRGRLLPALRGSRPGRIFAHFFGVDPRSDDAHTLMEAAEKMLSWDDPRSAAGRDALTTFAEECERIQDVALAVADLRRENPGDDMVSWVLAAEWEGEKMEDWEIGAFFSLLGSAANDTTRHSLAHAVRLFDEHPDQKALLLSDLDTYLPNAIEEVLRHSTPVMHFRRTALADTEIRGVPIKEGEKVVMWYSSGDRDEEQFPDAARFDITRPNAKTHLAFGAGGPHFCIGAGIGRAMINAGLREIYTRIPDIHLTAPQEIQENNFMHGVHAQPVAWTPRS